MLSHLYCWPQNGGDSRQALSHIWRGQGKWSVFSICLLIYLETHIGLWSLWRPSGRKQRTVKAQTSPTMAIHELRKCNSSPRLYQEQGVEGKKKCTSKPVVQRASRIRTSQQHFKCMFSFLSLSKYFHMIYELIWCLPCNKLGSIGRKKQNPRKKLVSLDTIKSLLSIANVLSIISNLILNLIIIYKADRLPIIILILRSTECDFNSRWYHWDLKQV